MYTQEQIEIAKDKIVQQIGLGKSLSSILQNDDSLPGRTTVYEWLNAEHSNYDAIFLNNYTRAREESADIDAEKIQDIAEKTLSGEYKSDAARVAVDALKWAAGVKQPKKYGAKVDLTSGGDKPPQNNTTLAITLPDGTELKDFSV